MKKMLTENLGIKLAAVIASIILWLVVINVKDPLKTAQYSVPVILKNVTAVTDAGMVYEILDNTDTVNVTVKAPRSVLTKLDVSDLVVTADFNNISQMNMIPLKVTAKKYSSKIDKMTLGHYNLLVNLEEARTKEFSVVLETEGTPAEGYTVGYTSATPNLVTVTGPVRMVDQIDKVVAVVSVEKHSTTMRTSAKVKLLKSNGEEINDERIVLSQSEIMTNVSFLETKAVDLELSTVGECANGYRLMKIESDPTTVRIAGQGDVLSGINTIEVPAEVLNIEGATTDVVAEIDITPYLPKNVQIPTGDNATVKITAKIEALDEKQFTIPISDIKLVNTPENMRASFGDIANITLVVMGSSEDLEQVSGEDLEISVDLTGLTEGMHRVDINVVTPEDVSILGSLWIDVVLESTLAQVEE